MAAGWQSGSGVNPEAPRNFQILSAYLRGVWDLRWDDPSQQGVNVGFTVLGVNVYRSFGSDRGPYYRVNTYPVGGTFYRDFADVTPVELEPVSWVTQGDAPGARRWVFRTLYPAYRRGTTDYATSPQDVQVVYRDGDTETPLVVAGIFGQTGEVTLVDEATQNQLLEQIDRVALNRAGQTGQVLVTYWRASNLTITTGLDRKPYYRLTTVALDPDTPDGMRETDLNFSPPVSPIEVETRDYIWREAIRRNQWILQQGGERVKVFIRRTSGQPCWCRLNEQTRVFLEQPSNRCKICYGTGIVHGFDGPFETIIAPDDGERRVSQGMYGQRLEHTYEVWMGPSPVVTQRDFIVKQTGERYSIGAVRRPSNRGNLLQQHFQIGYIDEQDIRYRVPVDGTDLLVYPQTRYTANTEVPYPVGADTRTPVITEKSNIPGNREERGRTGTHENITY